MMTDPNALAAKAWEKAERAGEDAYIEAVQTGVASSDIAMAKGAVAAQAAIAAVYAPRLAELEAEVERLRRNVKGWVEWHRRCDADDDCTYLNDNAWCDAEALASTGMGLLARTALGASHD